MNRSDYLLHIRHRGFGRLRGYDEGLHRTLARSIMPALQRFLRFMRGLRGSRARIYMREGADGMGAVQWRKAKWKTYHRFRHHPTLNPLNPRIFLLTD